VENVAAADLLDDLRTPSLFAPKRLVIVDRAQALIAESAETLIAYADNPGARAILVLVADALDARKKGVKKLLGKSVAVACAAVKPWEVPRWCSARARFHGKRLDPPAAKLLVDLVGPGLGQLDGQIQALAAYCRERERIGDRDVADLVGGDHARTVWELAKAISAHSTAAALRALERLLREPKVTPSWIVGSLAREARDLWRVRRMLDERRPPAEIERGLGKPGWLVKRLIGGAHQTDARRLQKNYRLLLQADVDSKTAAAPDAWLLQTLVLRLCAA